MKTCQVEDCDKKYYGKGFCNMHYLRNHKYGSPDSLKKPSRNIKSEDLITSRVDITSDGCWEWNYSRDENGYGLCGLNSKVIRAHRVSYEIFKKEIPGGQCVLHECDNPPCVNPEHLFLGTRADNVKDMDNKGRRVPASSPRARTAKLTWEQVNQIRLRKKSGETHDALAKEFQVHKSTIQNIWYGKTWRQK